VARIRASGAVAGKGKVASNGRAVRRNVTRFGLEDEIARAARARKGSPFLSTEQAAFYLGLSARKLQAMRAGGTGPAFRRHSRYVRYHIDDLDAWSKDVAGTRPSRA
jgi:hypothetical protein